MHVDVFSQWLDAYAP